MRPEHGTDDQGRGRQGRRFDQRGTHGAGRREDYRHLELGNNLVLNYTLDVQGMSVPTVITLVPVGDKWKASFDFADGQFQVDGTADKKS